MNIELKLFASLSTFLPQGAVSNKVTMEIGEDTTPAKLIDDLNLPAEACFLVLLNGVYLNPRERKVRTIQDGDAVAIWPPIAGG